MAEGEQGRSRRRSRSEAPILSFDPGRVFTPANGRDQDFSLGVEVAAYRARKGQAGNRGQGGGGPHHFGCRCPLCVRNSAFDKKAA